MEKLKRASHAVYVCAYHFVWATKYRKQVITPEIKESLNDLFRDIAEHYDFEIDTMEFGKDHIHLLISAPPRYSPSQIVNILKSISGREIFKRFPKLRRQYWGGEFWINGYFVKTVGAGLTLEMIRRYIKAQREEEFF